jgi:hypothetical protein
MGENRIRAGDALLVTIPPFPRPMEKYYGRIKSIKKASVWK